MVILNPLESAALICALEDAVLQLNILSILDGDKGRSGATLRPLTDETDLGESDRIRRQRGRIKTLFERLIGRLSLSADIASLIEMDLAGTPTENKADMDDMEGEGQDWQDATDAKRKIAEIQADIEAAKLAIADFQHIIPNLEQQTQVEQVVVRGRMSTPESDLAGIALLIHYRHEFENEIRYGESECEVACHIGRSWAHSQLQLEQRTHCRHEDATRRLTQDTRIQKRQEYRVHTEIVRFLEIVAQDMKQQAESWQEKYKKHSAHWNKKLKILLTEKEEHSVRLKYVAETLGQRMEFCNGVLESRERRRVAAETRRKRNEAAIRIQAWWRGHMVRRGFGAMRRRLKQKQQKQRASKA